MPPRVLQSAAELRGSDKLLIFGGSFDPPHWAHVTLPREVRQQIEADWVVYVPAARSPHKQHQSPTPPAHRLAMLQAALAEADDAVILTTELDRTEQNVPSYTVDTLEQVRHELGEETSLRLLIGADQVPAFDQWHRPDRIAELAPPLVMLRPPQTKQALLDTLAPDARKWWGPRIIEGTTMDVSATDVRQRLAAGEPIDDEVPAAVAQYIRDHDLYRELSQSD
jgi:nicotinate-nucleotide adenylyltransferase